MADTQLISKFNKGFWFWLCVIGVYSKDAWVVPLTNKKSITITNAFQQILDEFNHKPNKVWVDKRSDFYNGSVRSWLQDNGMQHLTKRNLLLLDDLLEP